MDEASSQELDWSSGVTKTPDYTCERTGDFYHFVSRTGVQLSTFKENYRREFIDTSGETYVIGRGASYLRTDFTPNKDLHFSGSEMTVRTVGFVEGMKQFFELAESNNPNAPPQVEYILGGPTNLRNAQFAENFGFKTVKEGNHPPNLEHRDIDTTRAVYRIGNTQEVKRKIFEFAASETYQKMKKRAERLKLPA